jgi:hypothetical protein
LPLCFSIIWFPAASVCATIPLTINFYVVTDLLEHLAQA